MPEPNEMPEPVAAPEPPPSRVLPPRQELVHAGCAERCRAEKLVDEAARAVEGQPAEVEGAHFHYTCICNGVRNDRIYRG